MKKKRLNILMLTEPPVALSRLYRLGIGEFTAKCDSWNLFATSAKLFTSNWREILESREFSGIIGAADHPPVAKAAQAVGVPFVNLYGGDPYPGIAQIGVSDFSIGKMAASYLMLQGFRNFGFYGLPGRGFSSGRWKGFYLHLRENGLAASRFSRLSELPRHTYSPLGYIPTEDQLYGWLQSLAKPAAIFCVDDLRATWVSAAANNMGLRIPDDIAILGCDNLEEYWGFSPVPISSIKWAVRKIGYQGACLLQDIIEGKKLRDAVIFREPEEVVERASSKALQIANPIVYKAMLYIMENVERQLSVEEVARHVGRHRRILDDLFRKHLGRTVTREIRLQQIEQVKKLLRDTGSTLESIIEKTCFGSVMHLTIEFKKYVGMPPGAYRRQTCYQGDRDEE